MAQPTPYNRLYDFSDYQEVNPTKPLRGSEVDAELDAIKLTTDQLRANAARIQRDDGALANQSVTPESLSAGALAMIHQGEYVPRGAWGAATAYALGDVVAFNAATYLCIVAHTSVTQFANDLTAGRWLLIANGALTGQSTAVDLFVGTGSQTVFALGFSYTGNNGAQVFVGGVAQIPGQDFTISGTTLTFVVAPPAPSVAGRSNVMVRGAGVEAQLAANAAITQAANASASATAAANSAGASAGSAAAAATSATNSANSATASAGSASTATTQANTATTQATNAAGSATAAAGSASTATTQAANAAGSATAAAGSATTATNQATIATTQATNAAGSASAAASSATNAAASAAGASGSASTATTQATNAAASATASGSSATASAASATSASGSAATAQNWAIKTDGPVAGGEYSAKHWAQEAAFLVTDGVLDDNAVSTVKTWSSDKLVDALKNGAHVTDFGAVGNGTTEDTTAVQAAINSGAKLIVFPAGFTFLIDQVTSAGTDTTFYCVGSTIKLKANSTTYRPLRINHARCTVIGGTWDGNRANQTAGDAFGSWAIGIHADDCAVYDAVIKNFRGCGVKNVGGNRCTVERCKITDIGYSTSLTCYGIYMETTGGLALYGNKARDNFIQLGNNGLADQGILFTSNSTTGGEAQWDWEISGNTVYGSTNASIGDLAINLAARGHRGKVTGNTTTGGAMGWSEGGDFTIIENNTFIDTVGSIRWGVEASGKKMVVSNNVLTGHLRGICFSFDNNDEMVIAGNTIETDGTGNHCIAAEIPVGGTGKNITIAGNMMKGRRAIIATRETRGMNVVGNTFVGPGSGTSGSRFIFFDTPVATTLFASIKANKISAVERAVSVYSASATTYTDIAFTGNNCRDDVAGGVLSHVVAEGSAVMGSRIKNFDNEQNSTTDNFSMLFDNTNKRGIEYSNSYATPEGNVTAGVGSIYLNLAGGAGTVFWIKESGTGNTGWKAPDRVSAGTVIHVAMNSAPTGYLKANGAAVSRTTYATLFAAIGTTFGVGDGSTTFALPDLRGEFIRGWDDARGVDSGRSLGTWQDPSLQSHTHLVPSTIDIPTGGNIPFSGTGQIGGAGASMNAVSQATGGAETRPRNVALLACIKF